MKRQLILTINFIYLFILIFSCAKDRPKPMAPENFLTLADISGKSSFKEDSPSVRVINIKEKAFIKRGNLRQAKTKALEKARSKAVDIMVRELLDTETYNKNYEKINKYISNNLGKYIDREEINAEQKIFNDTHYGISASFKVNRQKTLVTLQKDLQVINTTSNTLITIITSKKGLDLSKSGIKFEDIEDALMNQIQTDLNQRGLRAIDFRNAVASLQTDTYLKKKLSKISKEQFMAEITGSSASNQLVNTQVQKAEAYYGNALSMIRELAKVVIEINILSVSGNVKGDIALSINITAKNISTGRGGAFANTLANVGRRGGPNVIKSAMITGLVKDTYEEMEKEFIPQVIKEMSHVAVGGKKLIPYELVMKNYTKKDGRKLRKLIKTMENDNLRYVDVDNSVPSIISIFVRYAGKITDLSDQIMESIEEQDLDSQEPITAPDLTDLVFIKIKKNN